MSSTNIDLHRPEWVRNSRTAYLASLLQAIGQSLGQSLLWPVRVYRARQALHQLSRMNARELRDIGLTPHDVQSAQALPLDADPTLLLADRARERSRNDLSFH
jgi:uncharacterized protein YjiS (DUF1127 family)